MDAEMFPISDSLINLILIHNFDKNSRYHSSIMFENSLISIPVLV